MYVRILKLSMLMLLCLLPVSAISQESAGEKFIKGTVYFTDGDYEQALEQWIDIYNTGYRSAELEYNIGNAYFKLNNVPKAILFYERAHLRKPADEDINYNLQIARTLVVDRFEEIPELFFVRWYNFMALIMPTNSWARISLTTFILCLIFLSVYFYSSMYKLKVMGFWLAILLLVVSLVSFALTVRNKTLVYDNKNAIISSPVVNGKSSPDISGTDLFVLHEGTRVSVQDKVGEWLEIRLSDGNKGWIPANTLEII